MLVIKMIEWIHMLEMNLSRRFLIMEQL